MESVNEGSKVIQEILTKPTKGYCVLYRRLSDKEAGIGYGPILQDLRNVMLLRISQYDEDDVVWAIQEGNDTSGYVTIENHGYF